MKKLYTLVCIALALGGATTVQAQNGLKLPQASTAQTLTQEFGLGKITLNYSRPNTKGRKIFGALEPYGAVWRTGANSATTITFTDEVMLEGQKVLPGEYALFTIPDAKEWTIILNKAAKQWGAYEYKQAEDVLRVSVKPAKSAAFTETFTAQFANVAATTAELVLAWENTAVTVHLKTDIDTRIMANIDEAMKGDKKPYFSAAQYYFENGKDLNKALEWMNEAEKSAPKAYYIRYWKARVQLKKGDKAGAIATAKQGVALAKEAKNDEYIRLNESIIAQAK
ncbi:DUF2911 domain-containing protein [Mucilaginibacter aquatilis]|uniref:DUF2911 domain-containing protein n=1 Tax=Mucilaginibacter aquatilis TaxID=1517760 RepID=A0A6I4I766_9SPHI|nr:DUF2911 domain-containing protein [Mucilaginibacter aquatilis]MVN90941.1 DUF2911 domain-containing protein [Mucilaginibacter aquatilis]